MSMLEQYSFYDALPTGKWTRIVLLEPGAYDDPIQCSLYITPLQSAEYEAISYTWGSTQEVGSITCQGLEINVTENLVHALRQVRYEYEPRHIWVDALCINQGNLQEKGVHVNMMGEIYSQAWRVIICFGDDGHNGESAKIAFDVIRDYNRLAAKYMVESRIANRSSWRLEEEEEGDYGSVTDERLLHALSIFEKPWFGRVWVFQEVGLSRDALLAYGLSTINFTEIMEFAFAWTQVDNNFPNAHQTGGSISALFRTVWSTFAADTDQSWYQSSFILTTSARYSRRRYKPEFEDVLFRTRDMQKATDPRDYVYAFLGHSLARSGRGELLVEADYTIDTSELRLRLFSRISDRSLRFLGLTWHDSLTDLSKGPSWCPHLDCHRKWTINGRYNASGGEYLLIPEGKHRACVNGSCLEASVYIVDTVLRCGEVAGGLPSQDGDQAEVHVAQSNATEKMLSDQPSLVEEYWAILETTESRNGLAYPDKALAFASTLLHSRGDEKHASTARSFGGFCREYCPTIQKYLEEHEWLDQWASAESDFIPFIPRTADSIKGERFFTTSKGYCGTSTPLVEPGDFICIIPSVQTPLVIRPVGGKDNTFRMIGSSYVYGMMYGEGFKPSEPGGSSPQALVAQFV